MATPTKAAKAWIKNVALPAFKAVETSLPVEASAKARGDATNFVAKIELISADGVARQYTVTAKVVGLEVTAIARRMMAENQWGEEALGDIRKITQQHMHEHVTRYYQAKL